MGMRTVEREAEITQTQNMADKLITGEELFAMNDIGRSELVQGRVVHLMPTGHPHGRLEAIIAGFLFMYILQKKLGHVLAGEVGIYTQRDPDSVRAADAAYISNERYAQVQSPSYLDVCPELIVEILSPDDAWSAVHEKLAEYFAIDAQLIWVIDPRLEQIHVYQSLDDVTRLTKQDKLTGTHVLPGFHVAISEIFDTADE